MKSEFCKVVVTWERFFQVYLKFTLQLFSLQKTQHNHYFYTA